MFQYKKNKASEYQKYLNANEIFSKEEIKYLKKLNPEIYKLFKPSSNVNKMTNKESYLNTDISKVCKDSSKKLISKKRFFSLFLEEIKKHFENKKDNIMTKVISLLINEMISFSKILQENEILNEFFHEIKKDKFSYFDERNKSIDTKAKKNIYSRSEKQFEHYISNGNNVFKYSQSKNNKIIKNSSFCEKSNLDKRNARKNNNKNVFTENGNNKVSNSLYYSVKKIKINEKRKNNRNNVHKSNSNNKISISKKNKSLSGIETGSNTNNKTTINKNKIFNYSIKKRLKFNPDKKEKNTLNKTNDNNNKKSKEKFSIIEYVNLNSDVFDSIETENFNIFELDKKIGRNNVLPLIAYYIFNRLGFHDIMNYNKYEKWVKKIDEGYLRTNSYHTNIHAGDVTQTCLVYLKLGKINEICNLSKNSKCSLFLSCMCHDYKHPGVNNNFLKETKSPYAIIYNDTSILENMHIAETFKLINSNDTYNIFDKLDTDTYKQIRKQMISCVLATDMMFHNNYSNFIKTKIEQIKNGAENNNKNNPNDFQNYMNLLIHSADISNPTKPFDVYFTWAKLVVNEFYNQGDKEKKLGLNCSCDRNKVTIYQSQLGFINYIVLPFFSLFIQIFPKLNFYYEQININKTKLINMEEEEKKKNEKNNK